MSAGLLGDVFAAADGDGGQGNSGRQSGGSGGSGTAGDDVRFADNSTTPLASLFAPQRSSSLSYNPATGLFTTTATTATSAAAIATTITGPAAGTAPVDATEWIQSEPSPRELEGDTPARQVWVV
jgi:hypothetical protein